MDVSTTQRTADSAIVRRSMTGHDPKVDHDPNDGVRVIMALLITMVGIIGIATVVGIISFLADNG